LRNPEYQVANCTLAEVTVERDALKAEVARLKRENAEEIVRHMDAHHGMQIAKGEVGTLKAEVARLTALGEEMADVLEREFQRTVTAEAEVARLTALGDALVAAINATEGGTAGVYDAIDAWENR
jgi:hypothetical protein